MRVVCIDDGFSVPGPKMAEICEVVQIYFFEYYKLEGYYTHGYLADCFIPLSDIDETEMIREPVKEIVNN